MRETKSLISINSSNSFHDCDKMFIPDFLKLDETIQRSLKSKSEQTSNLLENLSQILGMSNY